MTPDKEEPNELDVLMKVLDIVKLKIETRELRNYETVQITQITNQFLPGTTIGTFIETQSVGQQGDAIMGDKYEAHGHAQVGAMGKEVKVDRVIFENPQEKAAEVDLACLLDELISLRAEMRNQASTTADDQAVVAIGQAISGAEEETLPVSSTPEERWQVGSRCRDGDRSGVGRWRYQVLPRTVGYTAT